MARKNAVVSVATTGTGPATTLAFTVEGHKPLILTLGELSAEVIERATLHGLTQKVSDAAALPKGEDGEPATPADKYNAIAAVIGRLTDGDWSKRGESTGESAPAGLIRRAFIEYATTNGKDEAKALAWYEKQDRKGQLALRNIPEIATIMERLKAERGAKTPAIDADALLAGLDL